MAHALHLLLLIVAARLFGELSERLGQPSAIGEILAGVAVALLAATALPLPLLAGLADSPFLDVAAEFGIFFLLLLAGIEMRPRELAEGSGASLGVALGGVLVPFAAGFALAWSFLPGTELKFAQAFLVGVALSISAVPVTIRILLDLGLLHSRVGRMIVSAAVFDDVLGLMLLAALTALIESGRAPGLAEMLVLLAQVAGFFAITTAAGLLLYPRLGRLLKRLRIPSATFSALIALALAFAALAEALGMDFILGPFVAGLFFEPETVGEREHRRTARSVSDLANGVLGPLFFVSIGVRIDLGAVAAIPGFLALLLAAAVLGKLVGAGAPARLAGLTTREAAAVGFGLSGRGAVELIVASVALEAGLFDQPDPVVSNLFSALVLVAVLTTLATPAALGRALGVRRADPPNARR